MTTPATAAPLDELRRSRVRQALDEHFARATGNPNSGLADFVQRLRLGGVNPAHRVVLSSHGRYLGCSCGEVSCRDDILLAWCDELIASYEAKVQEFAAETQALVAMRSERDALLDRLVAAEAANEQEDATLAMVEGMCHWVQRRGLARVLWPSHEEFHRGGQRGQAGVCPYFAVAEVLRGHPDPREATEPARRALDGGGGHE